MDDEVGLEGSRVVSLRACWEGRSREHAGRDAASTKNQLSHFRKPPCLSELHFLHCEIQTMANTPFASMVPGLGEITGYGLGTQWIEVEKGGITITCVIVVGGEANGVTCLMVHIRVSGIFQRHSAIKTHSSPLCLDRGREDCCSTSKRRRNCQ